MEHVHRNLRESCCDVEKELEEKQVSQPYSRLFDTVRGAEYVNVSSESIRDLCKLNERLGDHAGSEVQNIPIKKSIQQTFEKT